MGGRTSFRVSSLSAFRAVDKLKRAGIAVLRCREVQKNVLEVEIRTKDAKKSFAILQSSCYNIDAIRPLGLSRLKEEGIRAAGLLIGVLLFVAAILFFESRVLLVEVVGSGAYYEREIVDILRENGIDFLSPMPRDTGGLTAEILALPRTEFCAFRKRGGVLTIEVQCSDSVQPIAGMPLVSEVSGTLEELVVVSGTPLCTAGERVKAGQVLVEEFTYPGGEKLPVLVIARATVAVEVAKDYALSEREAKAQALLDFGEHAELRFTETEKGWHAEGVARYAFSCNF